MRERILVTGGAGFLGSILVPALLKEGFSVTVLDRFNSGEPTLATCCSYTGFIPVKGDVRDEALVMKLVAKSDIIVPLAALVGAPLCAQDPSNAVSINRDAVLMLVKLVGRNQKLVFPTSNSGYGVGEEDQYCTEESLLRPVSLYGKTKVEAEKAVLDSGNGVTLRLATVFGMSPRMRTDLLVNDFVYRALTDRVVVLFESHFKRNYIHIKDVAQAFIHTIANYSHMNNQPYNVGLSSANLSKYELCQKIKAVVTNFTVLEAPFGEDPDKRDYIVSNEKFERTGWHADWSLERGILELVKGFTMLRGRRFVND